MPYSAYESLTIDQIAARVEKSYDHEGALLCRKAYDFAARVHADQKRKSGEPYIIHPVYVASILTEIMIDPPTIAAGFLHDTVEDCPDVTLETIEKEFSPEIAQLVDGVTKLGRLNFTDREEQQAESLRKMILAMSKDIRVVLIKLADRLHNMLTLKYQSPERQIAIARETLDIYAPLAHRLGVYAIKQELEDLSLRYIDPEGYQDVARKVGMKRAEREANIKLVINELSQGHRIIVGVDSGELWSHRDGNLWDQTLEFFDDLFHGQEGADHALIVAGVEVNPNDPSDVKVILTDPGTGDLRIEYSLDEFMDAWEDSNCFMVATNDPAPYQYDESRGVMVPSNFACQAFLDNNTYPLSEDALYIPEGYSVAAPYYDEGHLNTVGHDDSGNEISYEEYSEKYKQALGNARGFGQDHFDKEAFVKAMKGLFGIDDAPEDIELPGQRHNGDDHDDLDDHNVQDNHTTHDPEEDEKDEEDKEDDELGIIDFNDF